MSTKHTPGTWHVNAIDTKAGKVVGDETTKEHFDKLYINGNNCTIATVYRRNDARLIATAPELLAAVKELLMCAELNRGSLEQQTYNSINRAVDALAKALGSGYCGFFEEKE